MANDVTKDDFAEYVKDEGLVTPDQVEAAKDAQRDAAVRGETIALGDALVSQGVLTQALRENIVKLLEQRQLGSVQLGQYRLIEKLGEGGMGAVYLAEDVMAGRQVAVKVLAPRLANNPEVLARFRRESKALGKLNHPNIIVAFAVGEDSGNHFFAMEYLKGEPLAALLDRGVLEWSRALNVVIQIARGLVHAHGRGVIHRDIKPGNIFLTEDGVAKILDLGLATVTSAFAKSFVTETGVIMGTPHYISPEQARGDKNVDQRTDIYSLGATFYHLITGVTPFDGPNLGVVLMKHLTESLPNPQDIRPDIPRGIARIVEQMMAKLPEDRYQNCSELLIDLELAIRGKSPKINRLKSGHSTVALPRRVGPKGKHGEIIGRDMSISPATSLKPNRWYHRRALQVVVAFTLILASGARLLWGNNFDSTSIFPIESQHLFSVREIERLANKNSMHVTGWKPIELQLQEQEGAGPSVRINPDLDVQTQIDAGIPMLKDWLSQAQNSLRILETRAQQHPTSLELLSDLAVRYQLSNKPNLAMEIWKRLIEISPKAQKNFYRFQAASQMIRTGEKGKGVRFLEDSFGSEPSSYDLSLLAAVYKQAGDRIRAEATMHKSADATIRESDQRFVMVDELAEKNGLVRRASVSNDDGQSIFLQLIEQWGNGEMIKIDPDGDLQIQIDSGIPKLKSFLLLNPQPIPAEKVRNLRPMLEHLCRQRGLRVFFWTPSVVLQLIAQRGNGPTIRIDPDRDLQSQIDAGLPRLNDDLNAAISRWVADPSKPRF